MVGSSSSRISRDRFAATPCRQGGLICEFRPKGRDPESTFFDVRAVSIPAAHRPEPPRAEPVGPVAVDELPFVLQQDVGNIERRHAGMFDQSFQRCTVSPTCEPMIFNMQRALDRYLAG